MLESLFEFLAVISQTNNLRLEFFNLSILLRYNFLVASTFILDIILAFNVFVIILIINNSCFFSDYEEILSKKDAQIEKLKSEVIDLTDDSEKLGPCLEFLLDVYDRFKKGLEHDFENAICPSYILNRDIQRKSLKIFFKTA